MSRLLEVVAPARMGAGFRWLLASAWVGNVGDGIALSAGPLLVASQSHDAVLVAAAGLLQRVPWLLLGLYAGAVADRVDRRALVMLADGARAAVVLLLSVVIVVGRVDIGVVLVAMFLLGVGEVFADIASPTLLPMLVAPADLGIANARLQAGFLVGFQLVGPPLGAFLFSAGTAWPFVTQTACVALGVVLVSRVVLRKDTISPKGTEYQGAARTQVRADIAAGVRWLMAHAAVRTLALVIVAFNVTWGAAWSVLVLYSLDHLHLGTLGFGLLTTMAAVGGLIGTASFGWLERQVALSTLMRGCLLLEVATHLALALTTVGWVAALIMVVFGAYAFVWGALSTAVRQRATPAEFQGRVGSVYMLALFAGIVIGQAIGGPLAQRWGLTAPFWFAFAGSAITLALVWRQLGHLAQANDVSTRP